MGFFQTSKKQLQGRKNKTKSTKKLLAVTDASWDLDHAKGSVQVYPTLGYYGKFTYF